MRCLLPEPRGGFQSGPQPTCRGLVSLELRTGAGDTPRLRLTRGAPARPQETFVGGASVPPGTAGPEGGRETARPPSKQGRPARPAASCHAPRPKAVPAPPPPPPLVLSGHAASLTPY